jgi:hypothetical protein
MPRPINLVQDSTRCADACQIYLVPAVSHASSTCYEDGMEAARRLARRLGADGWFTGDHTHVVPIPLRPQEETGALKRIPMSDTLKTPKSVRRSRAAAR